MVLMPNQPKKKIKEIIKMKNVFKISFIALCLLVFSSLFYSFNAQAAPANILTAADILGKTPAGDESQKLFQNLLGNFYTSPLAAAGGSTSLIGAMFLVFNSCIFVVGMLWAGYGLIGGIAETAQTGEVLGKRLSAVWLPIRMVTGIAGIVPVFGGFSLAQVLIVTMTALGIGIANAMLMSATASLANFSGLTSADVLVKDVGGNNFSDAAEDLFYMHVCAAAYKDNQAKLASFGAASATVNENLVSPPSIPNGAVVGYTTINNINICGKGSVIKTGDSGRVDGSFATLVGGFRVGTINYSAYATAVSNSYTQNFGEFSNKVKTIADDWYTKRKAARDTAGGATAQYPIDLLKAESSAYFTKITTAQAGATGVDSSAIKSIFKTTIEEKGWIGLGSWFSTFAEANAAMADAMKSVKYTFEYPKVEALTGPEWEDLAAIKKSMKATNAVTGTDTASDSGGSMDTVLNYIGESFIHKTPTGNFSFGQYIIKQSIEGASVGSGGGGLVNPIIMFKNLGDYSIGIGEALAVLSLVKEAGSDVVKDTPLANATDVAKRSLPAKVVILGAQKFIGLIVFLAPYMIVIGAMMAIYIPLIPFITWMGAVTQYAVVVCQGLVGAPIAALSHLEAEGEGLGRRTEAGYMFVLNVTFRPALMLFGFFLASALMISLGTLQAKMFITAMASAQGNSVTGFVSFVGFITIFMIINITLIQGLFNMIFLLPDQVLGLIGSAGAMTDIGKESESKIHGVFVSAGRVGSGGLGAMGAAGAKKAAGGAGEGASAANQSNQNTSGNRTK